MKEKNQNSEPAHSTKAMKEEIQKELEAIAPNLAKVEKKNPFKVPANYFSAFPDEMMEKIKALEQAEPAVKSQPVSSQTNWLKELENRLDEWLAWIFQPKPVYALASVTAVLLVSVYVFKFTGTETDPLDQLAEISTEEIDAYILDNMFLFDEDIIVDNSLAESLGDLEMQDFDPEFEQLWDESLLDGMDEDFLEDALL